MPKKLKVDFHAHTAEDPQDFIPYTAKELIDTAARQNFNALAITNHDSVLYTEELIAYAAERGILLLPGMEATLSRKHILIINPGFERNPPGRSLSDLAEIKRDNNLIIAPHPYFPKFKSLRDDLLPYLPFFDAVEFSQYHCRMMDFNTRAVLFSQDHGLSLVGTSDSHILWRFGKTYSFVEAEKNIPSIISAVKRGRIEVRTSPLSTLAMSRVVITFAFRRLIEPGKKNSTS